MVCRRRYWCYLGVDSSTGNDPNFVGTVDERDTSVNLFGGVQFHKSVGVEFGYVDLGKITFDALLSHNVDPCPWCAVHC